MRSHLFMFFPSKKTHVWTHKDKYHTNRMVLKKACNGYPSIQQNINNIALLISLFSSPLLSIIVKTFHAVCGNHSTLYSYISHTFASNFTLFILVCFSTLSQSLSFFSSLLGFLQNLRRLLSLGINGCAAYSSFSLSSFCSCS
jgi:hypothetical protein